jgi:hypothetical protein
VGFWGTAAKRSTRSSACHLGRQRTRLLKPPACGSSNLIDLTP